MSEPLPQGTVANMIAGRYVLLAAIARGGMATIHIARLMGAEGFSRIVAAKRLHPQFIEDVEFVTMFLDEARIASKVRHVNVVSVLDVVATGSEVILVQEYVHGVPLNVLLRTSREQGPLPVPIVTAIASGILRGLHAAHETRDEMGQEMHIVHRDVSPQNVMMEIDGTPRLLDFGVAKASTSAHVTQQGTFKGKLAYVAPEQLRGDASPASDIYSFGVILWEMLVGRRLHQGLPEAELLTAVLLRTVGTVTSALEGARQEISDARWGQIVLLEPIVARALASEPEDRFATAAEMADALTALVPPASGAEVGEWVRRLGKEFLAGRDSVLRSEELSWRQYQSGATSSPHVAGAIDLTTGAHEGSAPSGNTSVPRMRSGVSGISTVAPPSSPALDPETRPEASRKRRRLLLLLCGAALAGVALFWSRAPDPVSAKPRTEASAPVVAAPASVALPSVVPSAAAMPTAPGSSVRPVTTARPPVYRAPAPPPPRPQPGPPVAAPIVPAQVAAPPTPPATCNPPYYFEGSKKLYKPSCL